MKTMHLFAGGGGGMYADLILGHTPTVAVEWEKAACDVLRARKTEWWPDCEIIEGDIRAFSGVRYAGEVDCIHAGFPCQDLSCGGAQKGMEGDRSILYTEAIRVFGEVQPQYLFFENVTGILTANNGEALNRVLSDLASIGFSSIRWTCLRAANIGASHARDRWWLLASNTNSERRGESQKLPPDPRELGQWKSHMDMQPYRQNVWPERTSGGRPSWLPPSEPLAYRVCDDVAPRVDEIKARLKILGNSQVPLQAAYAWVMLGGPTEII